MTNDQMREAFEAWWRDAGRNDGEPSALIQACWQSAYAAGIRERMRHVQGKNDAASEAIAALYRMPTAREWMCVLALSALFFGAILISAHWVVLGHVPGADAIRAETPKEGK